MCENKMKTIAEAIITWTIPGSCPLLGAVLRHKEVVSGQQLKSRRDLKLVKGDTGTARGPYAEVVVSRASRRSHRRVTGEHSALHPKWNVARAPSPRLQLDSSGCRRVGRVGAIRWCWAPRNVQTKHTEVVEMK